MFDIQSAHASGMLAFAGSYATLAMIPGPNFVIVARASLAGSRMAAVTTAGGVAAGASLLALLAASSCAVLFTNASFHFFATIIFAAMLLAGGARLIGSTMREAEIPAPRPVREPHFGLGFLTALTNPLSAVFFASASVTLDYSQNGIPAHAMALTVFLVAACWFGLVAIGISAASSSALYMRCRRPFGIGAGLLLIWYASTAVAGALAA
ncbi:hypothetical protein ASD44_15160 [Mesorhizobium sp. Root554]|uniref:LysE family translocator n=1 Tax=unclassified Mesorhizobium TaxID=325217 RepID=UPI0006FB2C37|nr:MULTISPECIES: LysE family transporter [unclassified Mesorhizobium]KQZ15245.1 hypothetical protein ASD27_15165 [Mesorhizobium sp. Root1471]KQZ37754.1 hypothetical protein ASD44_15160 [Mesorhizobium sp. Root554]